MKMEFKVLLIGFAFLVGCQAMPYKPYARKVKVKPKKGGTIALKLDHNDQDREYAEKIMSKTCYGKTYDILDEGEVVIGTTTTASETSKGAQKGSKVGSLFGIPVTSGARDASKNSSSTTLQKKEWQINYKCTRVARTNNRDQSIR